MPCYDPRDSMTSEQIREAEERSRRAREELIRLQREQNELLRKQNEMKQSSSAHKEAKAKKDEPSIDYNSPLNKMTHSFCTLCKAVVESGRADIIADLMENNEEFKAEFVAHQKHDKDRGEEYIDPEALRIIKGSSALGKIDTDHERSLFSDEMMRTTMSALMRHRF